MKLNELGGCPFQYILFEVIYVLHILLKKKKKQYDMQY